MNLFIMLLGLGIFASGVYNEIQLTRDKAHSDLMIWVAKLQEVEAGHTNILAKMVGLPDMVQP